MADIGRPIRSERMALVIIRGKPGLAEAITVTASADGLRSGEVVVRAISGNSGKAGAVVR